MKIVFNFSTGKFDYVQDKLERLSDVDTTGKATGKVLKYNAVSGKWEIGDDNNTLYTAGTGLLLTGTQFSTNDGQINHNNLLNTHNLTTDINHANITGGHNLTTDIDHNALTNYVANRHLDWTNASSNFLTSGTLRVNNSAIFQNAVNSTTAFQVNNALGTNVLNVDTTNRIVSTNGDVIPDLGAVATEGLNARVEQIMGDKSLGQYGFNPSQFYAPSTWATGEIATGRDDFFVDNYAGGTEQWTAISGCTPHSINITSSGVSWLFLQSGVTGDANNNHAIIEEAISTSNGSNLARIIMMGFGQSQRVGFVVMNADMTTGAAMWLVYDATAKTIQLLCDSYSDSGNAWLSHANAKTSNVAYTTGWTNRYTGSLEGLDLYSFLGAQVFEFRQIATTKFAFYIRTNGGRALLYESVSSFGFTKAKLMLFVEGNVGATAFRPYMSCDFIATV